MHGDVYDLQDKKYYKWIYRKKSLQNVDKIVAISHKIQKQSILDVFPEVENKLEVIYNGFDIEEIRESIVRKCVISLFVIQAFIWTD